MRHSIGSFGIIFKENEIDHNQNYVKNVFLTIIHQLKMKMDLPWIVRVGQCQKNWVDHTLNINQYPYDIFNSILNLNPMTNDNHYNLNKQIISFMKDNIINNHLIINKSYDYINDYDIIINNNIDNILCHHIISNKIDIALYISNRFNTKLLPNKIKISKGATKIMSEENAGGESELSECFSFEVLHKCLNAKLLKTEMEIKYWSKHCKITDYSVKIDDIKIGVSVTRAMKYNGLFNKHDAMKLLKKKLNGINESTNNVLTCDQWQRQILHIWATHNYIEDILRDAFKTLIVREPELVNDTIVLVTVASDDMW